MYKKMKLKGVISSLLAACLTAGLFAGCNTAPEEPAGTAEVTQEDTASTEKPAGADADSLEAAAEADTDSAEKKTEGDTDVIPELTRGDADGFLHVTYDPSGQYSVSFGAGDLITSQTAAGRMDEEMDRTLDAEEMTGEPADITDDGDGPADAAEEPAEGAEVSVPGEAADDGPSEDSDAADTEEAEEAAEELSEEDSEEPSPEETAEPAQEAAAEEKTEEEISETAPVTEEETVSDEESPAEEAEVSAETDFSGIRQEDLEISYVIQEQGSEDIQQKYADITGFKNEDGIIELIFTDPDAAEYKTQGYLITALGGQTGTMIEVDFEDHSVTADISEISAASDSTEVTLSLAEGSFSDDIKPEDITLGQSFKEMSVDSVKANGGYLTLALSGSPVLEPEVASVYTAGEITVASDAVVNGRSDLSAYIDVQAPMVGLDQSGIEENGDTVTFPMTLTGMEAEDISASDVSFDGAGTVTDVSADGDRLLVTVKADDGNTADLYGDLTVGDAGMVVGVSHASVNAVFDYIEMDGDDLLITLNMYAVSGSIAEDISEKSFSLDMDFEGGSIESTDRTDEDHAEVVIRFPANGMTDEDYSVLGAFTLAEGALIDEDGSPAPEFTCARQYIPEEMGRDRTPMDMINDYISFGKEAYKYGKPVYDVASSIASGNYVGAAQGAISFFSAIFGDDDSGPDVGKELQEIKAEIAKIHNKLDEIDQAVGRIADQTDQNRLADF